MTFEGSAWTEDAVLDGRLRLRQPRRGHRVGHDAILLAAACPARAGDAVVDLGAGVGAAGLARAARVAGTTVTLLEIEPGLATLARHNIALNDMSARVRAVTLDVGAPARAFAAAGLAAGSVARALMNPPFHDVGRQRASPDPARALAHAAPRAALASWARTAARLLRPRGTLTLIFHADGLEDGLAALAPAFGAVVLTPVYPRPDKPAIRILVSAVKGGRAPLVLKPPLLLADAAGRATTAAHALLREAAALA
ncbi:MAG: methyltransferase [Hyphomicrobiales bacterium]|nr:methyltransferase [Hyphomicrobiales bacterium]